MAFDPSHVSGMLKDAHRHMMQSARLRYKARISVDNWAKSSCLDLCTEMQSRLPRELRNLVYASLLQSSRSHGASSSAPLGILKSHPHVRDPKFMGQETLTELAEEWYHKIIFCLDTDSDVSDLLYSGKDIWGLPGIDVARHIRNVHIEMQPQNTKAGTRYACEHDTGLPHSFDKLAQLQKLATLTLNLEYGDWNAGGYSTNDEIACFNGLAEEFVEVLGYLIGKGVKVGVTLFNDKEFSGWVGLEHLGEDEWSRFVGRVRRREVSPMA